MTSVTQKNSKTDNKTASKSKQMIKLLIKLTFATLIIGYLVKSGKLDFSLIKEVLKSNRWIYAFLIIIAQIMTASIRWKLLVELKTQKPIPVIKVFSLTWIGQFFNSFLPGAVTGDFVKVYYAKKIDPNLTKTFLLLSAFLDRFIGLVGLLFLMGTFSIVQYSELTQRSEQLKNLVHFNAVLFIGAIVILSTIFLKSTLQDIIIGLIKKLPIIGEKVANIFEQIWLMGSKPSVVIKCVVLSLVSQSLNILAFYTITSPFYSQDLSLINIFTFVPLGLIATAIPITPAGIGVGHAAFDKLFEFYSITNGASLFNIFFILFVCVNSLGVIPFILSGKKPHLSELEEMS